MKGRFARRGGGMYCAVALCSSSYGRAKTEGQEISFHRFPKKESLRKQWIAICKRKDLFNPSTAYICSLHFRDSDFERNLRSELMGCKGRKILKMGTIPCLNLPLPTLKTESAPRQKRSPKVNEKKKPNVSHAINSSKVHEPQPSTSSTQNHFDPLQERGKHLSSILVNCSPNEIRPRRHDGTFENFFFKIVD